jgi:hypothetical protein
MRINDMEYSTEREFFESQLLGIQIGAGKDVEEALCNALREKLQIIYIWPSQRGNLGDEAYSEGVRNGQGIGLEEFERRLRKSRSSRLKFFEGVNLQIQALNEELLQFSKIQARYFLFEDYSPDRAAGMCGNYYTDLLARFVNSHKDRCLFVVPEGWSPWIV